MKEMGPFARMVRHDVVHSEVKPWTPKALIDLIAIYMASPSGTDSAIVKNLFLLAMHPAMKAVWHEVSDPVAATSLSMTAAVFATLGPGEFDGKRLIPKEVDDRCKAVHESVIRLQKALRRTPFLLTNDASLAARLQAIDAEAQGRIGSDRAFGKRDRGKSAGGRDAPQFRRAFRIAVTKILRSHGHRNITNLVTALSIVLLGDEPDAALVRRSIRKTRTDVKQK